MDIIKNGLTKGNIPNALGTAAGDIIYFSAPGVPAVLAKATDGQVLTLASGLPSWANAGGGEDYGYLRNVALQNALDILEMQAADTLDSGQTANLIRDIFSDANGYLNTVDINETDAFFNIAERIYTNYEAGTPSWTEVQPAGNADKNWWGCSVSGTTIVAGVASGRLYVSTNSGANWTEVRPAGDADKAWRGCSVSGTTIVAGDYGGRLYVSTNSGANWTEVQPAGDADKAWNCCSVSDTGIVAGIDLERLFFAENTSDYYDSRCQTLDKSLDIPPTHFQFFAWKTEYTLTGNITIDVSFNGGTNWQTGIALDTPTEITNTGTEMILKINLNKGASDGEVQLAGYGIMLWGEA